MLCNLVEIKMFFYGRTRLLVIKYGFICHQTKVGVSRSHSVRDKLTVLNVYIVQIAVALLLRSVESWVGIKNIMG